MKSAWVRNGCQICLVSTQLSECSRAHSYHSQHALGCARSTHSRLSGSILHLAHHSAQLMFPSTYHSTLGCAPNSLCQASQPSTPSPTHLSRTHMGRCAGTRRASTMRHAIFHQSILPAFLRRALPLALPLALPPPEGPQAVLAPCTSFRGALQGARWGRCGVRAGGVKGIGVSRCCSRGSWNGSAWPAPRGRD